MFYLEIQCFTNGLLDIEELLSNRHCWQCAWLRLLDFAMVCQAILTNHRSTMPVCLAIGRCQAIVDAHILLRFSTQLLSNRPGIAKQSLQIAKQSADVKQIIA